MTGEMPRGDVDHIDGDRANNIWANLRDVSHKANLQNRHGAQKNNKSGFLGVHKRGKKWAASIAVNGRSVSLGRYPTPEDAHHAYLGAKRLLHRAHQD